MLGPFWGVPASGHRGRWTALIEPITGRSLRFHLLKRSHATDATAVVRKQGDRQVMETVKEYAVRFTLEEFEEGLWPTEPTIRSAPEVLTDGLGDDLRDFLQAIVDCAAQMGIGPTQQPDVSGELAVTRDHLEDMRRLVFKDGHAPLKT